MSLSVSEVQSDYDRLYAGEGLLSDAPSFYRWALENLRPAAGGRLLDVACGLGLMLREGRARGLQVAGVDLSRVALCAAAREVPGVPLVEGNGEALPFPDRSFDYVTSLGSLEHYLDPWTGLAEMRRVLKPAGRAAILVPNSYYLADIVWHVLLRGRGPSHLQVVERFATRREWETLLEMMGLHVERVHAYNFCWPRDRRDLVWYRRNPRKLLYLATGPLTPRNLAYSFLYICSVAAPREDLNLRLPLVLRRPREGA